MSEPRSTAANDTVVTGQFRSFTEWVNKARSWIGGTGAVCTDAKGRVLHCGADFMRARDEGAFPVTYRYDLAKVKWDRMSRRQRAFLSQPWHAGGGA